MRRLILTSLFLTLAVSVGAQQSTPATPTAVEVLVLPATGDPMTVAPITNGTRSTAISATLNCNLAAAPAGSLPLINPSLVEVDDPFTPGRKCRVPVPINLPNGTGYRIVVVFEHAAPTADSSRSLGVPPFDIAGTLVPHAAPTGVAVRP